MLGISFAILALLAWATGDFLIQKTVRAVGDLNTLLWIDVIGIIILFPFVAGRLPETFGNSPAFWLATLAGVIIFATALFEFEALRRGKLSVIEPVMSIELLVTVALAALLWGEELSLTELILIVATFIGIVLAVTADYTHLRIHKRILEKGVLLALVGAVLMGVVNFLVGASSQTISPLFVIWWSNVITAVMCVGYLLYQGNLGHVMKSFYQHKRLVIGVSVVDNAAWAFYALAASVIPISIATTISESYIALAVLLGIFLNREKIRLAQKVGIVIALICVIMLSYLTQGG